MKKSVSPCKDCTRRVYACHDTCPAYLDFRKDMDKLAAVRREKQKLRDAHVMLVEQVKKKFRLYK